VKLVNEFTDGGATVQDKLNALSIHLQMADIGEKAAYKTLVIDTGDELYQSMKAARTFQNGGEFTIADWGWIGDAYREVMLGLIDLPMDVIVLYHIKSAMDEDTSFRELMLQGQAKDEAPGWFDIVGVLDTFESVQEDGVAVTKRVLLTHSSRTYPWVKDHSGALPRRFQLSSGITDDYPRMMELVQALPEVVTAHEELEEIQVPEEVVTEGQQVVPSPEELHAKKEEVVEVEVVVEETVQQEPPPPSVDESGPIPSQDSVATGDTEPEVSEPDATVSSSPDDEASTAEPEKSEPESQEQGEPAEGTTSLEEAAALVAEELGGVEVEIFVCDVCGDPVEDKDLRELTQIRFRKYMCREHFRDALNEAKGA
jgi:hypothetical protein